MQSTQNTSEHSFAAEIVDRILSGDSAAEREMVDRYHKGLVIMLFNRCKDRQLSEDVAQDTWVLVLQKVRNGELKDNGKLASFIIQIGKNQLIMQFRARDRHTHVSEDEAQELPDSGVSPDQALVNGQLALAIKVAMEEMSQPRDRELIRRFYLVGDDKSSLCKEYALSEAHFDRVLFRARERFKKLWLQYSASSADE